MTFFFSNKTKIKRFITTGAFDGLRVQALKKINRILHGMKVEASVSFKTSKMHVPNIITKEIHKARLQRLQEKTKKKILVKLC
jgi:hypothetical protein